MKPRTKGFATKDEEKVTSEVAQASNYETVRLPPVKIRTIYLIALCLGLILAARRATAQTPSAPPAQASRAVGVVTQIKPGSLTLRLDVGSELQVQLPEDVAVLRVPPGAKDLKTATHITVGEINPSDRVLVRGRFSDDQKSFQATSVVVMTRSDLASAHEAEAQDWQRRGTRGVVKAVDLEKKEITIAVPNTPPTPGNPTHPVVLALAPNAVLLRYAPDSVKFSDAKPTPFDAIKVGDQVRALGTKSEDGSRFTAEKLVSGTFRNVGATVISVNAAAGAVTVKDSGFRQTFGSAHDPGFQAARASTIHGRDDRAFQLRRAGQRCRRGRRNARGGPRRHGRAGQLRWSTRPWRQRRPGWARRDAARLSADARPHAGVHAQRVEARSTLDCGEHGG